MLKPYRMPDGSYIFAGKSEIYRTPPLIDPGSIVQISFKVPALPDQIEPAVNRIEEFIRQFPFKEYRLDDFIIAISEAVNNAVTHDGIDASREVNIHILYIPKVALWVGITDDLGPLEIKDIKMDVVDEHGVPSLDERGRGFFIMCSLCSSVSYFPEDGGRLKEIFLTLIPEPAAGCS